MATYLRSLRITILWSEELQERNEKLNNWFNNALSRLLLSVLCVVFFPAALAWKTDKGRGALIPKLLVGALAGILFWTAVVIVAQALILGWLGSSLTAWDPWILAAAVLAATVLWTLVRWYRYLRDPKVQQELKKGGLEE